MQVQENIFFSEEGRNKLKAGIDKLAKAVTVTLGPNGKCVVIQQEGKPPHISKDGVTVAKSIYMIDVVEEMGAEMVRQVAQKTVDMVGDGTTTATLFAHSILTEGMKAISEGVNSTELKRGIDEAVYEAVEELKKISIPLLVEEEIDGGMLENIATISANNDAELGKLISEAVINVGKHGEVSIQESLNGKTYFTKEEGIVVHRGYISPVMINNSKGTEVELINCKVLICDKKISKFEDIQDIVGQAHQIKKQSLLIICDEMDSGALGAVLLNKVQKGLQIGVIRNPGYFDNRKDMMQDIATYTGANCITEDYGRTLKDVKWEDLGTCGKVIIKKDITIIIDGKPKAEELKTRIEQITNLLEIETDEFKQMELKGRLANLTGGIGVLHVGGVTDIEAKERRDRVDDALNATKAAIEEGIVPGGGTAFLVAANKIYQNRLKKDFNLLEKIFGMPLTDEEIGVQIVVDALRSPLKKIIVNSGMDMSFYKDVLDYINSDQPLIGLNAKTANVENLIEAGVIDPLKVARVTLQNAASIAGLILTTEAVIGLPYGKNED